MNEEELKLLNKLDDLPNKLNLEIRGLILAEVMLRKENQKLKKQLEEQDYTVIPNSDIKPTLDKYKNQQKEFIKYLEDEIMEVRAKWGNALSNVSQLNVAMTVKAYEDILSKYKEIIGGK